MAVGVRDIKSVLDDFATSRRSPTIAIILPERPLTIEWSHKLKKLLASKNYEKVYLIIHSGGGDINVSFQMIEVLRLHCKCICAVIPLYAKSAATLFCLGADEIIMDELAELGPLDTQIREQKRGGEFSYTSALNPFKTLEQLREFSLETLDITVKLIMSRSSMTPAEALEYAVKFVGELATPLLNQLSTEKLGEYSRALSVATEYGERLLRRYSKVLEKDQDVLLERLIYGYPSHDYIIDYQEALELGLPVKLFEETERPLVDQLLNSILKANDDVYLAEPRSEIEQAEKVIASDVEKGTILEENTENER